MPTLAEIRQQFPQYNDVPDAALADALHKKYYSDLPRPEFDAKIGLQAAPVTPAAPSAVPAQTQPVEQPQTVQSAILPLSKNTKTGEYSFDSDAGVVGAIKRAVTLPGDVAQGKFETKPEVPGQLSDVDEARSQLNERALTGRALEMATVASPVTAPMRAAATAGVKALPEVEAIKDSARAAYKAVDDAGVVIAPQSFKRFGDDLATTVVKEGIDPTLHPGATAVMKRFADVANEPLALTTFDTLRQVAKEAAASSAPGEARLGSIIIDKIDDFVGSLGIKDVSAAAENPQTAAKALFEARKLWSVAKRSEVIGDLMERATIRSSQFSGSGLENAIRTEFRQLAMNKSELKTFPKDEQALIKRVATGGITENTLRMLGKFAPTGIVSSVLSGSAGAALGGGVGAVAVPAAGFVARQAATQMTKRNVRNVESAILSKAQKGQIGPSTRKIDLQELAAELTRRAEIVTAPKLVPIPNQ